MGTVCAACLRVNCIPENCLCSVCRCQYCGHNLCDGLVIECTANTLDKLLQDELPVIVGFSASWCRPCRNFIPVFAALAAERSGTMRFAKVDIATDRELVSRFSICGVPTFIIFKNGQILDILSGIESKEGFNNWLDETLCVAQQDSVVSGGHY